MDILWQISSRFFDYSWHLWQSDVQTLLHGFSTLSQSYNSNTLEQHHDELYLTCERWLLCLKIIRQLIVSGFPSDAKCVQVANPPPPRKKKKKRKQNVAVGVTWKPCGFLNMGIYNIASNYLCVSCRRSDQSWRSRPCS